MAVELLAIQTELRPLFPGRVVGSFAFRKVRQLRIVQLTKVPRYIGNVRNSVARILALTLRRAISVRGRVEALTNLLLCDRADRLLRDVGSFAVATGGVFSINVIVDGSLRNKTIVARTRLGIALVINSVR